MKNAKKYLLLCMVLGVMLGFAGCGNRNTAERGTDTATNFETTSYREEGTSGKNDVINDATRENGTVNRDVTDNNNIVEDIESGVENVGEDVSNALKGNR